MDNRSHHEDQNRVNSQLHTNQEANQFASILQHLLYMQNQQQYIQSPQMQQLQQQSFQPTIPQFAQQFQQQQFIRPQIQNQQAQNFIQNIYPPQNKINGIQDNQQKIRNESQHQNVQMSATNMLQQGNFMYPQPDLTIGALKDLLQSAPRYRPLNSLNSMNPQPLLPESNDQDYSQMINDFLLKILNMFVVQNQILLEFKTKNLHLESTVNLVLEQVTKLQTIIQQKLISDDSNQKSSQSQGNDEALIKPSQKQVTVLQIQTKRTFKRYQLFYIQYVRLKRLYSESRSECRQDKSENSRLSSQRDDLSQYDDDWSQGKKELKKQK